MGGPGATICWAMIGKPGGGREKSETVGGIAMSGAMSGTVGAAVASGWGAAVTGDIRDIRDGSLGGVEATGFPTTNKRGIKCV